MTSTTYEISPNEEDAISEIRNTIGKAHGHLSVVCIKCPGQAKMSIFNTPHLNIADKLFDLSLHSRISKLVVEQFSKEYEIRLILENDLSDTNIGPDMIECIAGLIETIPPKKPSLHDQHPELNQTLIDLWRKKKHPWMYK